MAGSSDRVPLPKGMYPLKVDDGGRLLLPADCGVLKSARAGETLIGIEQPDGSLKVRSCNDLVREVQEYFAPFVRPGESWSDELLRERRDASLHE